VTGDAMLQNTTLNGPAGKTITATAGNTITAYQTFSLADLVTNGGLTNATITTSLPAHTTYVPGSLSINGKAITGDVSNSGLTIPLSQYQLGLAQNGDQLAVSYQYQLTADTLTGTITTPAAKFNAQFTFPNTSDLPAIAATTPTNTITVQPASLTLSTPTTIDFGQHHFSELPATFSSTTAPAISVQDSLATTTPWTLSAQLTAGKDSLPGRLTLGGKTLSTTATSLYQSTGATKGTIDVSKAAALGNFKLAMTHADLPKTTATSASYQGSITWTLSAGPTQ
jgi:hypothetical protein